MKRCLTERVPRQGKGGAGLGLFYCFSTLHRFLINIEPGKRTEMIGIYDLHTSQRDVSLAEKSLSVFELGENK